ncbi:MAG: 23S rRNA pseudouridine synthase [bacterium P3]|nr:MAG: 23S rRNA pseudouridine synthase [bacterium P3]KWW41079.1 MAG: 23S rRNA pseudouridine synthase [bacterium F083]
MSNVCFHVSQPCTLFNFLVEQMPYVSKTQIKQIMAHEIKVDGKRVRQFDFPLQPGMVVERNKNKFIERFRPQGLDILYEDNHLLVVNKHEGLLSYSLKQEYKTVITELNRYLERKNKAVHAHIVHRLDRDTSGLMVVSKSKEVSRRFEEDWKNRVYDRAYVAVAWGAIEPATGTVTSWLTDGPYCVLSSPTDNGGKKAVTHYRVLRGNKRFSLVELRLDTGRRNQIRVHLREMQHPVVHDPMYGYKDDAAPIGRLALHAYRLCFIHPVTGRKMEFETPVPPAFLKLVKE